MFNAVKPSDIFICKKCGDCCKGYGGTFLTDKDIKAIAGYIDTDPKLFVADFCRISGGKPVLAQGKDGFCIFWNKLCTIHPVKPRMCREWPFIKSLLVDINNWHIMAGSCPGIRDDVPDSLVKECVRRELIKSPFIRICQLVNIVFFPV